MTRRIHFMPAMGVIALLFAMVFDNSPAADKEQEKSLDPQKNSKPASPEEPPQKLISTFMRTKLDASKDVLDGVVTENYLKVRNGAERMLAMSKAAEWNAIQGPVYAQYSSEFRRSVERLMKEADDKDIDGTGLAYMQLTMNCVSCHKYIKGTQIVQNDSAIDLLGSTNEAAAEAK